MRNLNPFSCMAKKPTQPRFFPHFHKVTNPRFFVFTKLAQPNGNFIAIAEIKIGLDYRFRRCRPVFMERINQVGVERTAKYLEVGVPLRAAKNDDMVLVHGTDSRGNPLIKRLKLRIVLPQLLEMRNWLVQ